jgi:hypothetical protein
MSVMIYSLCHVNPICELEFIQHVLLMVSDTTLSTVRKIEGHKIVESWHKAHIMVKILNFMVA